MANVAVARDMVVDVPAYVVQHVDITVVGIAALHLPGPTTPEPVRGGDSDVLGSRLHQQEEGGDDKGKGDVVNRGLGILWHGDGALAQGDFAPGLQGEVIPVGLVHVGQHELAHFAATQVEVLDFAMTRPSFHPRFALDAFNCWPIFGTYAVEMENCNNSIC